MINVNLYIVFFYALVVLAHWETKYIIYNTKIQNVQQLNFVEIVEESGIKWDSA